MRLMKKIGILGGLMTLGVASLSSAYAGFRGTASAKENLFSVVSGKANDNNAATIVESELDKLLYGPDGIEGTDDDSEGDPDYLMALDPGSKKVKDPAIKSNVAYNSLVFMKVEVPLLKGTVNNKDGSFEAMKLLKGDTILNDMEVGETAGDYKLMHVEKSDSADKKSVYYFGYLAELEGTDHEDEKLNETTTLFDEFSVNDFTAIDGKYLTTDADIDISAFLMQSINPTTHKAYENIDEAWQKLVDAGVVELKD